MLRRNECTPDEAELARWFRPPPANAVRQRDGESFADYLGRSSIETFKYQVESEARARRAIASIKAAAWDEGEMAGLRRADYEYGQSPNFPRANPYRQEEER